MQTVLLQTGVLCANEKPITREAVAGIAPALRSDPITLQQAINVLSTTTLVGGYDVNLIAAVVDTAVPEIPSAQPKTIAALCYALGITGYSDHRLMRVCFFFCCVYSLFVPVLFLGGSSSLCDNMLCVICTHVLSLFCNELLGSSMRYLFGYVSDISTKCNRVSEISETSVQELEGVLEARQGDFDVESFAKVVWMLGRAHHKSGTALALVDKLAERALSKTVSPQVRVCSSAHATPVRGVCFFSPSVFQVRHHVLSTQLKRGISS